MIKNLLRSLIFNALILYLIAYFIKGVSYQNNFVVLAYATLGLTLGNYFLKPLLKILLLPINIITLGLFRWVTDILILYLVVYFVPGFQIQGYFFPGQVVAGYQLPAMFLSVLVVYILTSFLLSLATAILNWIAH